MGGEHFICLHDSDHKKIPCIWMHNKDTPKTSWTYRDKQVWLNLCQYAKMVMSEIPITKSQYNSILKFFQPIPNNEEHLVYYNRSEYYDYWWNLTLLLSMLFPGKFCMYLDRCPYLPPDDNIFNFATIREISREVYDTSYLQILTSNPQQIQKLLWVRHPYSPSHSRIPPKLMVFKSILPRDILKLIGTYLYNVKHMSNAGYCKLCCIE